MKPGRLDSEIEGYSISAQAAGTDPSAGEDLSCAFTESLAADMIPAYPGWGSGDWTCGTAHPLSRVQPDMVLSGRWQTQPIINIPIE